jgi:hypothetical protein
MLPAQGLRMYATDFEFASLTTLIPHQSELVQPSLSAPTCTVIDSKCGVDGDADCIGILTVFIRFLTSMHDSLFDSFVSSVWLTSVPVVFHLCLYVLCVCWF